MPKPQFRSCSTSIRSPLHQYPNNNSGRVPTAYGRQSMHAQTKNSARVPRAYSCQSIHAQTTIPLVFHKHTVTTASIPKQQFRSCSKSIRSPEHPCPNHNPARVPRAYSRQSIHAKIMMALKDRNATGALEDAKSYTHMICHISTHCSSAQCKILPK